MTARKCFTMVVEEDRTEQELAWDGASVPELLVSNGQHFIKIGRYASPGDRYRFRRVEAIDLNSLA